MIPVAKGRTLLLAALVLASLMLAGAAAAVAFCIQRIFDVFLLAEEPRALSDALAIAATFALAAVAGAGLEIFRAWAGERLGLGYVAELREALFSRIIRASRLELSRRRQGGLLLPFVGDLTAIRKWVSDGLVRLISASATGLILLCVLGLQSPPLAIAAGIVIAPAIGIVLSWSGMLARAIREARLRRGAVANFVSASIRAAQTVQAFSRFSRETARLRRRNDALMQSGLKLAALTGGVAAIVYIAAAVLVAVILWVGVLEVERGAMSVGLVAAALSLSGLLAGAVRDLGISFELWRRAKVSFAKVASALALDPSIADDRARSAVPRRAVTVSLERVSVAGVLESVDAEANEGDVVHVLGVSGAGKSTLLSLIARLRDPDSGRLRLAGRDMRRIKSKALRKRIGVASAAVPLMHGSVDMNLRYRLPNASADDIAQVEVICGLKPVFERLPGGRRARLSEGASELSLGETQKLQIARAMLGSPPVLVLDEVDSHLDPETAARLAAAIGDYPGIVFMAAASPALCGVATTLWRLERGALRVELGASQATATVQSDRLSGLDAIETTAAEADGRVARMLHLISAPMAATGGATDTANLTEFATTATVRAHVSERQVQSMEPPSDESLDAVAGELEEGFAGASLSGVGAEIVRSDGRRSCKRASLERASSSKAPARKLAYHETPGPRPRQFFLYEPENRSKEAPLVVSVHGIARNAAAHAYRLMAEAERFGLPVVAPLFDKELFGQYQQLMDAQTGVRADLALIDIIEAVGRLSHVRTDQVLLFGYSGGAQFTHRFVFAHPRRVTSAVHVAAGWYTFPDPDVAYPFGLGVRENASTITLDLAQALKVPQHVLVGAGDVERDSSLRQSRRIDRQQGDTRLSRAQNWVAAMELEAQRRPGSINPTLAILPRAGHSFVDSVESAALPSRIFQVFVRDAGLAPVQG